MKPILLQFKNDPDQLLYEQLYNYLKQEILHGQILAGERLPSLRQAAKTLGVSVTTVQTAYEQLLVEGYVESLPQSGFYACDLGKAAGAAREVPLTTVKFEEGPFQEPPYRTDPASFNFVKWKKAMSTVLTDCQDLLLYDGDRQGEPALRREIARYVYSSRGVVCTPDQIVISAGTQQLMNHLARILRRMNVDLICAEDPGYRPAENIFRDRGFAVSRIPVNARTGIDVEKLPENVRTAVYVIPSNQFPTGAILPVARRYELLEWSRRNASIIIEDDYDSELRYFGKPLPSLQGLDPQADVVYLGSFSSTLCAAVRISFMVLPPKMADLFRSFRDEFDQPCSKAEQLALALFMERGFYRAHINKLRRLYAHKLRVAADTFHQQAPDFITTVNTSSGINMTLQVRTKLSPEELSERAKTLRLQVTPAEGLSRPGSAAMIFYYNQVPSSEMAQAVADLIRAWRSTEEEKPAGQDGAAPAPAGDGDDGTGRP